MSDNDLIVMKIGGSVAGEDAAALDAIVILHDSGHSLVVVVSARSLVALSSLPHDVIRRAVATSSTTRPVDRERNVGIPAHFPTSLLPSGRWLRTHGCIARR